MANALLDQFGNIDIYLFDQILRGRIAPGMRVVDAGCGSGRNLTYLLRAGYDVWGADTDPGALATARALAATLAPSVPAAQFLVEPLESLSLPDALADVVIVSAVLHFARNAEHFGAMVTGAWRVLRPGGLWFARLASNIGMPADLPALGGGRFRLPDGSDRYLVDAPMLMDWTERLGGVLLDPLKTTVVQDQRSMTTWVARKS